MRNDARMSSVRRDETFIPQHWYGGCCSVPPQGKVRNRQTHASGNAMFAPETIKE
jgi:hypothetical protein